jgi:hypothetical protein
MSWQDGSLDWQHRPRLRKKQVDTSKQKIPEHIELRPIGRNSRTMLRKNRSIGGRCQDPHRQWYYMVRCVGE